MKRRVVDPGEVLAAVESGMEEGRVRRASGGQRRKIIRDAVEAVLEAAPFEGETIPPIVGLAGAAKILDVKKQYVIRLRNQGALVPAEQLESGPVFLRSHVEDYRVQLEAARRAREEREAAREAEDDDE